EVTRRRREELGIDAIAAPGRPVTRHAERRVELPAVRLGAASIRSGETEESHTEHRQSRTHHRHLQLSNESHAIVPPTPARVSQRGSIGDQTLTRRRSIDEAGTVRWHGNGVAARDGAYF